jgi:hypothetical protein
MEDSPGSSNVTPNPRVRITTGEILPNGAIVDLVAVPDGERLHVLLWNGKEKPFIAPAIDGGAGIFYQPLDLDPTVREAITFPSGAVEYGTDAELFAKVSDQFRNRVGLPEDLAVFATCWTLSTWILELMLIPVTLVVSGVLRRQICNVLRLFGSLCRRALPVAELSRGLPFSLNPTLLINDPRLSAKACASWQAANCHGLYVAGAGSTVRSLCCSKAVVLQPGDSPQVWGEEAMFLMLPPTDSAPLTSQMLTNIAAEFQPQLEMFRLRRLSGADQFVSTRHPLSRFELVRNLGACVPEDPEIVRILTPLLESHQQDVLAQRSCDPRVAILEAIWIPSHDQDEITVGEITKRTNAILRSRGATQDYNVKQIGWKLKNLNFRTSSNGKQKVLAFWSTTRSRVHKYVQEFRLQLPFRENCKDCQALQGIKEKPVE